MRIDLSFISRYKILLAVGVVFFLAHFQAQATNNYQIKKIDFDIPIADNSVRGITIDSSNVIWFYNSKGLYKFNGSHLIYINKWAINGQLLNGAEISSISVVRGSIYICTNKGLFFINTSGMVSKVNLPFINQPVTQIICNSKNDLILLTRNGDVLFNPDKKNYKIIKLASRQNDRMILIHDTLFIASVLNPSGSSIFKISPSFKLIKEYKLKRDILTISLTTYNTLPIVVSGNKILIYNQKLDSFLLTERSFNQIQIVSEQIDKKEVLLVESPNIIHVGKSLTDSLSLIKFDRNEIVYDVLENTFEGNCFIGTSAGLYLLYKSRLNFDVIEQNYPAFNNQLLVRRQVLEDKQNIYLFYYCGILKKSKSDGKLSVIYNKPLFAYSAILDTPNVWIGADGGDFLKKYSLNTIASTFSSFNYGKGRNEIVTMLRYSTNLLLLGSYNNGRLYTYDIYLNKFREVSYKQTICKQENLRIRKLVKEANGNVLAATNHGVFVFDKELKLIKQITLLGDTTNEFHSTEVHDVFLAKNKSIWLAMDDGLVELSNKDYSIIRNLDLNQKLKGRKCIFVTQDHFNRFWIATYKGLFCYDDQIKQTQYYTSIDGLPDDEYNYNACRLLDNGQLIFGGLNAYIRVNPDLVNFKTGNNQLNFSQIVLKGNTNFQNSVNNTLTSSGAFEVNKGKEVLELKFAISDYLNPKECNYWYKIEDKTEWMPLGNNGVLQLWDLPKGENKILIKAENSLGVASANILSFTALVKVPFYQELWFYILAGFFIVIMVVTNILNRLIHYRKVRDIKTNLLYDIHDELGGLLTQTSMRVELMKAKEQYNITDLKFVLNNIKEAMQAVRNLIWSLDSGTSDINNLVDRARANLEFIFKDSAFDFHIIHQIGSTTFDKSIEVKRNILLIIKEAATNTLKHSNGNMFTVSLTLKNAKYHLQIADNGNSSLTNFDDSGYGISSIKKRVETIKGNVTINQNDKGFFIEVIF